MRILTLLLATAGVVCACGGGSVPEDAGDPPFGPGAGAPSPAPSPPSPPASAASAAGRWVGTGDNGRTLTGLVFDDGSYWMLYSAVANPALIGGVVQGRGGVSAGGTTFSSDNALDFNVEGQGVQPVDLDATFAARSALELSLATDGLGTGARFAATYDPTFELQASLLTLAGAYGGTLSATDGPPAAATLDVLTGGEFTGASGACGFSGRMQPRSDANAFDTQLTFGAAPCPLPGQTLSGIAWPDANRGLSAAWIDATRSQAVLFTGTRP